MTNPDDIILLENINLAAAILSLGGSFWMTCFCLKSPGHRTVSLNLILAIAVSDFVYSIANIMASFDNYLPHAFCATEAFLRVWSFNFSVFWATCIPLLFYKISVSDKPLDQNKFFIKAGLVGFVWCAGLCLV